MVKRAKIYINKDVTEKLGALLRKNRIEKSYSLDDLAHMTQFPKSTILNIEKGNSTNINYYVAYGQAVGCSLLRVEVELKPLYELSPDRKNRQFLTVKIKDLLKETAFFDIKRSVREVLQELKTVYKIDTTKTHSTNVSTIMLNLIEEGAVLLAEKKGRNNLYIKKHTAK
jgi:transcriptional regulator with XRE-family HTH domain